MPALLKAQSRAAAGVADPAGLLWSAPATWGGTLPVAGQAIVIASGVSIILDVTTPILGAFQNDGTFTFARKDLTFRAASVVNNGTWNIGSVAQPFAQKAIVELSGAIFGTSSTVSYTDGVTTSATFFAGSHPLVNNNDNGGLSRGLINMGTLNWYGAYRKPWLKPANGVPMSIGTTALALEAAPAGWAANDDIVIGSNVFYPNGNLERFTLPTTPVGAAVTLPSGLVKPRYNNIQYLVNAGGGSLSTTQGPVTLKAAGGIAATAATPTVIDQRVAVGNLTRNIVLQGANDAAWSASGFGAHLMTMNPGVMHVDGVQFVRCGQDGRQGRYPLHWHMWSYVTLTGAWRGAVVGQFVRNCAIDSSSNRGIVVHGTNGAVVDNNVLFNTAGSALFTEDGSSEDGFFRGNAVLGTVQAANPVSLFEVSDLLNLGPPGIWLTNARYTVTGNHINRSLGVGIWNAFAQIQCLGASVLATDSNGNRIRPRFRQSVDWNNNTVIAPATFCAQTAFPASDNAGTVATWMWQPTDNELVADTITTGGTGVPDLIAPGTGRTVPAVLKGLNAFKGMEGGYFNRVQSPDYSGWTLGDNLFFGVSGVTNPIFTTKAHDMLLVGTTLNADLANDPIPSRNGTLYSNRVGLASYHGTLNFFDMTYVSYPYQVHEPSYYVPPNGKISGGGVLDAGDLYLVPVESVFARATNWSLSSDSSMGYRMKPQAGYTWTLAGAIRDKGNLWGAGADSYILQDFPFLTTGAASPVALGPSGAIGKATLTKYYGCAPISSDAPNLSTLWIPEYKVTRVDNVGATIGAPWIIVDGRMSAPYAASGTVPITVGQTVTNTTTGSFFIVGAITVTSGAWAAGTAVGNLYTDGSRLTGTWANAQPLQVAGVTHATATGATGILPNLPNMRHFAAQQGGRYVVSLPNDPIPTARFVHTINGQLLTTADYFTVAVPWNGAGAHAYQQYGDFGSAQPAIPTAGQITAGFGKHINTSVASIAAVEADTTGLSYWYDTTGKVVWLRVSGGLTFTGSVQDDGTTNSDAALNRNMALTVVPTATTGGF